MNEKWGNKTTTDILKSAKAVERRGCRWYQRWMRRVRDVGLHFERLGNGGGERENLKRFSAIQSLDGLGTRVRNPKVRETLAACARRGESLPRGVGKDAVGGVRRNLGGAKSSQQLLAFNQRRSRLHEIVDDNDVSTNWFTFLQLDDALRALSHLGADDGFEASSGKEGMKSLVRPFVCVRNHYVFRILQLLQPL